MFSPGDGGHEQLISNSGRFKPTFAERDKKQAMIDLSRISTNSSGIFKQSMGSRKRVGIGLLYRPARLHILAELVPWNRFLGSLKV